MDHQLSTNHARLWVKPFLFIFFTIFTTQAFAEVIIDNYELMSSQRVSRTNFQYNYKVHVNNLGQSINNVQGTFVSTNDTLTINTPSLSFGNISAGSSGESNSLLTVIVNRSSRASIDDIVATFSFDSQNQPPIANAGNDKSAFNGEVVALNGAASSDADGDPLTYSWSFISKPTNSNAFLSSTSIVNPTFVLDQSGNYELTLIVNDGFLDSAPDNIIITTENSAPVADAGPNQSKLNGQIVSLSGSSSYDVDGDPLTYFWEWLSRPIGSNAELSDSTSNNPTFTIDVTGEYSLSLIVDDGQATSAPDTVAISTDNTAPIANAGPDQSVPANGNVNLDGTSSTDVDGDLLDFNWAIISKPDGSQTSLSDRTAAAPTFFADQPGTYIVQLTVFDGTVNSPTDTVTISSENTAPIAHAGADQSANINNVVTLDGSQSRDNEGFDLTFRWTFTAIPIGSAALLADPNAVNPSFTIDIPGTYIAQLIVSDGYSDSAPDTIVVSTENSAPVAQAGTDQTTKVDQVVNLDGSASSDVDGDVLTYQWSISSKPSNSNAQLNNNTAINPWMIPDLPGSYIIQLVVNDGALDSQVDTVLIKTENSAPVANAGADQSSQVQQLIQLDGTASTDVDGDSLTYQWSFNSRPQFSSALLDDPTAPQPTFSMDEFGTYIIQLIVNDGNVNSAPDTVSISSTNSIPVANAGPDQSAIVGESVILDGSASNDVDGNSLTFSWSFTQRPSGSTAILDDPTKVMPQFTLDLAGEYIVQLIVNDGTSSSTADTIRITTTNTPPTANAGENQSVTLESLVTLNAGSSTDNENDPLTYRWSLLQRPVDSVAQLSPLENVISRFTADKPGSYVAQLIVNDGEFDSNADTVTISTLNSAPVANAGQNQVAEVGDTIPLDGSGSYDVDGDPLTYSWSLTTRPEDSNTVIDNASEVNTSFVADLAGEYLVQLIVNDGNTNSSPDSTLIAVSPPNNVPTVNAGPDQGKSIGSQVTLQGSANDADGDSLTYLWTVTSIPAGSQLTASSTLNNTSILTPVFTPDAAGQWQFSLVANDGKDDSDADTIIVYVSELPSSVSIGGDNNVDTRGTLNLTLTLDNPAPAAGNEITLSSNNVNIATVPETVFFNEGQTSVNFALTTLTQSGSVNIAASGNGLTGDSINVVVEPREFALVANLVGLGRTTSGMVTLASSAPSGGATIELTVADPNLLTVTPTTLFIPQGQTQVEFNLIGGATVGATQLSADGSEDGYTTQNINIVVTDRLLELPNSYEAALGEIVELRLLAAPEPAPAGGHQVTISTSDSNIVEVLTPTVTIPEGSYETFIRVQAIGAGEVNITAASDGFSPDTTVMDVTVALNLLASSMDLDSDTPQPLAIQLESGGKRVPAPANGAAIQFTSSNNSCVATPAAINLSEGQSFPLINLEYAGTAALPCTTTIVASNPLFGTDSVEVMVTTSEALGTLSLNSLPQYLAKNMQGTGTIRLSNNTHNGRTVRITSLNPEVALVSKSITEWGAASIEVFVPAGQYNASFQVQSTQTGNVAFTASAKDYGVVDFTRTANKTIAYINTSLNTTTINPDQNVNAYVYATYDNVNPWPSSPSYIKANPGGVEMTLTLDDAAVATWVQDGSTASTVSATVPAGGYSIPTGSNTGSVKLRPLSAGEVVLTATAPDSVSYPSYDTNTVNVTAPSITRNSWTSQNHTQGLTAKGMQGYINYRISGANHGGIEFTLTSSNPNVAVLSSSQTLAGANSITFTLADGQLNTPYVYVQGLALGTTTLTLSSSVTGALTTEFIVTQPIAYISTSLNTTTINPDQNVNAYVYATYDNVNPWPSSPSYIKANPGGVEMTLTLDDAAVATWVQDGSTASTVSATVPAGGYSIPTGSNTGSVKLRPLSAGEVVLTATAPDSVSYPSYDTNTVNVTAPSITRNSWTSQNHTQGLTAKGMQGYINYRISGANHGGIEFTLTSSNPNVAVLSSSQTLAGANSITFTLADGQLNTPYVYVQGLALGTTTLTLSSSVTGALTTEFIVTQPIAYISTSLNTTTINPDQNVNAYLYATYDNVNPWTSSLGSIKANPGGVEIALNVDDDTVATLVKDGNISSEQTVVISEAQYYAPTSGTGSVKLRPLSAGEVVLTATAPDSVSYPSYDTNTVNVTAPSITRSNWSSQNGTQGLTAKGMQGYIRYRISGANHGGIEFTLTSSNPNVAVLSSSQTLTGANSITFTLADGQLNTPYVYVQGLALGTTTLTLSSSVTSALTTEFIVTQPIAYISTSLNTTTINPDQNVNAYLYATYDNVNPWTSSLGSIKANPGGVEIALNVDDDTVATLVKDGNISSEQTVVISEAQYYAPTSGTGSVKLRPLSAGEVVLTATAPDSVSYPSYDTNTVTVTAPTITLNPERTLLGSGLQYNVTVRLSGNDHGGVTIRVASGDTIKALIGPDGTTAGASFYDLFIPNGSTTGTISLQSLANAAGPLTLTASSTGYIDGTTTVNIIQPLLSISNLSTNQSIGAQDHFYVYTGVPSSDTGTSLNYYQSVSAAIGQLAVTIDSDNQAIARLVGSSNSGDQVIINIPVNAIRSANSVAEGGVAVEGVASGSALISVSANGFKNGSQDEVMVNVN